LDKAFYTFFFTFLTRKKFFLDFEKRKNVFSNNALYNILHLTAGISQALLKLALVVFENWVTTAGGSFCPVELN